MNTTLSPKHLEILSQLDGKNIFMTGGTGFFGKTFLRAIQSLAETEKVMPKVTLLTRDSASFRTKWPILANLPFLSFHEGDLTTFDFPDHSFDSILHFATPINTTPTPNESVDVLNSIISGTQRVLDFAVHAKVSEFLLTSSGAVYGTPSLDQDCIPESYLGAPSTTSPLSAYGEGKRVAELIGNTYGYRYGFEHKVARCFSFVGPYLSPHSSFAISSFIRSAIKNEKIAILGDGTPIRSYLDGDDLVAWLVQILAKGEHATPYNVGSNHPYAISELAEKVVKIINPELPIEVAKKQIPTSVSMKYVPCIAKASHELGLNAWTSIDESIRKTAQFYKQNYQNL